MQCTHLVAVLLRHSRHLETVICFAEAQVCLAPALKKWIFFGGHTVVIPFNQFCFFHHLGRIVFGIRVGSFCDGLELGLGLGLRFSVLCSLVCCTHRVAVLLCHRMHLEIAVQFAEASVLPAP